MSVRFERAKPNYPVRNGEGHGDYQETKGWSVRWVGPRTAEHAWVVDYDVAVCDYGKGPVLELITEWTVCTDPQSPGDTEVWADATYSEVRGTATDDGAKAAADRLPATDPREWPRNCPYPIPT